VSVSIRVLAICRFHRSSQSKLLYAKRRGGDKLAKGNPRELLFTEFIQADDLG
jgi:hypothetical protein